jgi:hypothetical protein
MLAKILSPGEKVSSENVYRSVKIVEDFFSSTIWAKEFMILWKCFFHEHN